MNEKPMLVSVVVPCMNEEESISHLVARLEKVVAPYGNRAEILLIDDGSTDGTWAEIEAARKTCSQRRGLGRHHTKSMQVICCA